MLLRWILRLYFIIFFKILCVTCARNSSLAFVIDDTRSMWDDIDQVREAAAEIMDIVTREKASEIEDVVLVTFNDPDVVLRKKTSKKHELIEALGKIVVHNTHNYDCPEYALTGIERALQESKPGSYLFVFTDASAKDYHRLKEIKSLCEKKQSQVVFILTGDCRNPRSDNYLAYHEIAKASTGQVFRVDKDDVKDVLNTIKETVKGHKSVVTSGVVPANYYRYTPFPFTVDDKTEYVIVSTSGRNVDVGVTDKPKRGGTRMVTERILWKSSGKVVKFDAPKPGTYYAWVKGESDVTIVVYARTDFTFDHGFSEFVPKYFDDTSKQPIADRKHHLSISVTDPDHAVDIKTVEILDMHERVLTSLPLRKVNGDFYITDSFVSPTVMFKIQVTGNVKKTGNVIKRISKTAIEPQVPPKPDSKAPEVTITEGTKVDVDYNAEISLTCKVSAYPEPNILWTAADGTVLSSKRSVVELPYDYISYLRLSHVKKSGTYFCKASNDEARNKISKIDVNIKPPIRIMSASTDTKFTKYGEETKLRCHVSSSFPLEIKWNTPLEPSDYSLSSDKMVLTIKSVNLKAQGTYTCEATLKSDPKQKEVITRHVRISDLAPPSISHASPGVITVSHAERIKIVCTITGGTPRPSISWQFKGNADSVFRDLSASGEELIVNSASLEDAGQYLCIAKNIKGESDRKTRVIVQKAPVAVILEGSKKTIEYGSTNELTCKTVAYPLPKVIWKDSRGNKLTSRETINNNEITSHVQIQNVIKSDTYYCYAENIMGNTANKIDLTVTSPISVQDHPSATTTLQYGATKDITCNIESNYPLKFKWFHQKSSSEISEIHTSDKYTISPNGITLRILSTDLDMVGKYTCEASLVSDENEKTSFTTDVQINNLSPPVLLNTATNQITKQDKDKITIPCKIVGGMPPPIVSWQVMRKGDNVFRDLSASGQELTIDSATLADAGEYRCIAKNAKGKAEKTTGVIVQKAPVAVILEGTKKNIEYGSTNELTCKTVAYPLPKIVWKDSRGNKLTSRETINNNEITSHVQIQNIIKSDTYYCYAENIMGNTVNKIDLTVTSPISVQDHPSATTTLQYGATKDITCNIESNYPLKFKWFHQKSSSEISEIHTSDKYTISPNGITLRILSTDLDMVGKYTCEASLVSDENEKTSFTTDVQINNLSPPVLLNTATNQITKQDKDKITIPCKIVGGMPPPIVSWQVMRKGDNMFRDLSASGQELTIDCATLADAGEYRCIAKNAKGQAEKTTELIVNKAPEAVIDEGATANVTYGSTNEFKCRIVAFPLPKITWSNQKGEKLNSEETITNHETISRLRVENVKINDIYFCYAKNDLGKTSSSIQVSVSSAIDFPSNLTESKNVNYGAPTTVVCDAKSSFPVKIKWFYQKNDKLSEISEISTSDKYSISPDKRRLYITSTDLDLVGKYTCEVSLVSDENQKQSYSTKVEINNLKAPEITDVDRTITIMKGQDITTSCKATGIPKPIVTWKFKHAKSDVFTSMPIQADKISNANMDYEWAGTYLCTATNAVGTQSRTIDIVVHGAPEVTNSVYIGVTGDKVLKIPCKVTGVPEPTITWKHRDKIVTSDSKIIVTKNELIIKNPTEKDSNSFTCEATNKYGSTIGVLGAAISDFVDFNEDLNSNIYMKPGESTDIKCLLPYPDPRAVRWYVNYEKTVVLGPSYSLQVANFSNDGNYTCRVNTDQGSESRNYVVNVGYKPSFTTTHATPIVNWNGNKRETLDCNVQAKPKEKVEWFYNGKPLDSEVSELPIFGWGHYTCKVSNVHGSVQQSFNVTSNVCVIDRTVNRVQNTPLFISDKPKTWPKFESENEFLIINQNQAINLACSTKDQPMNSFKTHPNAHEITAECYKEDQFIVDGKQYNFKDLQCNEYLIPSAVFTKKPCMNGGEIIEVGFKLDSGFLGVYEICYSKQAGYRTQYTKAMMSNVNIGNKVGPFFNLNLGMKTGAHDGKIKKCRYNQRRFVSPLDVAFGPAQIATLSDKNVVLVYEPCEDTSRMSWRDLEEIIQNAMYVMDSFTVWTGASHYNAIGVPRYLWKVVKFDDDSFETAVYVNAPNPVKEDIMCSKYTSPILSDITESYDDYTYSCTMDEFLKIFKVPLSDFGIA